MIDKIITYYKMGLYDQASQLLNGLYAYEVEHFMKGIAKENLIDVVINNTPAKIWAGLASKIASIKGVN